MADTAHQHITSTESAAHLNGLIRQGLFPGPGLNALHGSLNSSQTTFASVTTVCQDDSGSQRSIRIPASSAASILTSDHVPLLSHGRSNSTVIGTGPPGIHLSHSRRASAPVPYQGGRLRKLFSSSSHPLLEAAKTGDTDLGKSLINRETAMLVDHSDNWTALHYAAAFGHCSLVQVLLPFYESLDPRTKRQDRTPLFLAVQGGHIAIVEVLLDGGADLIATSKIDMATPLHRAALEGNEAMVQMLLARGSPVNALDIEGMRPLMWAVQGGNPRVVEFLVAAGAELEGRTVTSGLTVLHRAVGARDARMVKKLLNLGANANADAPLGLRCLHRAATAGDTQIAHMLVQESSVDVNARTVKNWTPLHSAARHGHLGVYQILIEAGADKDAVNTKGLTAIELARKWGFENIV